MRSPPEDVRRWLVAVGLLAGPAASGGPSPGPARRIPQISTAGDAQLRLLRLAFSEDILSGLLTPSSVYTGVSSPSLFSSLLSALCAAGHVQASAEAASSIIISASHVRIFQRGLSLQRLATYSATASALAS